MKYNRAATHCWRNTADAILIFHEAGAVLASYRSQPAGIVVVVALVDEITVRIGHNTASLCVKVVRG